MDTIAPAAGRDHKQLLSVALATLLAGASLREGDSPDTAFLHRRVQENPQAELVTRKQLQQYRAALHRPAQKEIKVQNQVLFAKKLADDMIDQRTGSIVDSNHLVQLCNTQPRDIVLARHLERWSSPQAAINYLSFINDRGSLEAKTAKALLDTYKFSRLIVTNPKLSEGNTHEKLHHQTQQHAREQVLKAYFAGNLKDADAFIDNLVQTVNETPDEDAYRIFLSSLARVENFLMGMILAKHGTQYKLNLS
jgi:hypothetical protein